MGHSPCSRCLVNTRLSPGSLCCPEPSQVAGFSSKANMCCGLCLQEKYVAELAAVRQTLQTDLETSIRRIADLQAALEEVASSDSDTER